MKRGWGVACVAGVIAMSGGRAAAEDSPWASTDYIDFQLPAHWACDEKVVHECRDTRPESRGDALIVFAGKRAREDETVPAFLTYLKQPKTWRADDGGTVTSRVVEAKVVSIAGQPWVSAVHDDAELRGFRTRYLVTVKGGIVVLVTFSARAERYGRYQSDIERGVQTARLKDPDRH